MKWLFAYFTNAFVPVNVVEAAAKNGHLPILKFLLENDAGRCLDHSHVAIRVNSGIVPFESVPIISQGETGNGIVVHWGGRCLLYAIEQKHSDIARWLYENTPHQLDDEEIRFAIEYALRAPDMDLAMYFLPAGRSIVEFAHDDLHPETVETLLEDGYIRQDEQCAAVSVYMLAKVGRLDLMQRIVQLHSPPRARPRFEWSSEWFYASKEACKFGDVEIVQWVMEHPIGVSLSEAYSHHHSAGPEHFFCLAAAGGHIEVMEYLFAEGYYDNFKDAARLAIQNNHFDALEWLLQHHTYFSKGFMIEEAAKNGRLEMVKYFHSIDRPNDHTWLPPFGNAMDVAAGHDQLAVVEWLHMTRPEGCTTRAMDNAAANGHLHMLQWLHRNRTEGCTKKAMNKAAANGHLEVVQWLHCNRSEGCTTGAMDSAAANGHVNVVKWLFANRSEKCTVKAIEKALENSHVRVAYWLQTHIPMWDPSVDTLQINDPNQFDILLFLDSYIPNIFNPSDPDQPRLAMITEPKDNHAVTWMKETHDVRVDSHR